MAGEIFLKEQAVATVTSSGASTTNLSATSAGTIDMRTAGTTNLIENLVALAELTCQWGTTTNIAAGTIVADLYLVPVMDGTNAADIDATAGASYIAANYRVGYFVSPKTLSTSTDYRFVTAVFDVFPGKYTAYILNRSGQTISVNWTLKVVAARAQYS